MNSALVAPSKHRDSRPIPGQTLLILMCCFFVTHALPRSFAASSARRTGSMRLTFSRGFRTSQC